ncbi:unnamed protein product, partial [Ectocarpus sp. 13 AM-2016]
FLSESGNVYSCGSNEFGQQGRGEAGSAAQRSSASRNNADGSSRETSRSTHPVADGGGGGGGGGGGASTNLCMLAPTIVTVTGGGVSGLRVQRVAAGDDHCTVLTSSEPNTATATASAAAAAAAAVVSVSSSGRGGGGAGSSQGSSSRRVFTWGLNAAGQCAHGRAAEVVGAPQEAELLSGARAVGCGAGHTMVVL